jgi:hypothetical protein
MESFKGLIKTEEEHANFKLMIYVICFTF